MPGWSGCDVCELQEYHVRLTVYPHEGFDLSGSDFPLPPGKYLLLPAEPCDSEASVNGSNVALQVVVTAIAEEPPLEEAKRRCTSADHAPRGVSEA